MSEYWKSTPKYWCKYCKTFVRDTKLERQNHDATPKHQGNLKRFLRDLHRGHEKDEKDKERAKSEVARLNALVSGAGQCESSSSGFGHGPTLSTPRPQATPSQRKQQVAQLAEMGVSIPEEFRGEMAMAGEWQVTSEHVIYPFQSDEKKPATLGFGVRKRIIDDSEEAGEAIQAKKNKWGSTFRAHPDGDSDLDLDKLFDNSLSKVKKSADPNVRQGLPLQATSNEILSNIESTVEKVEDIAVKLEPKNEAAIFTLDNRVVSDNSVVKQEDKNPEVAVVFKKRSKVKNMRQK